jgi:hypothetical protein
MHVMVMIAGIDAKKTTAQDAPGTIFSRGWLLWYPPFSSTPILKGTFRAGHVTDNVRATEDDVDAATPMDAQNAPTGVWKSRREREIPTAPTSIIILKEEEKKRRTKSKSAQTNCSPNRIRYSNRTLLDNAVPW